MVLSLLFAVGLGILVIIYFFWGTAWAKSPYNTLLYTNGELTRAGVITDRNGTILAETINGKRVYNSDVSIRKSTIHLVGDPFGYIGTGLHSSYFSALTGYGPINGSFSVHGTGNNIELTLDSTVCSAALKALGKYSGTVGVYNYKTGETICMVSTPTYDYNSASDTAKAKNGTYNGVFVNRFISSTYTPGSTFKIVTAAAAIDTFSDAYTRTYTCKGGTTINGEWLACAGNHGTLTLKDAFAYSCNSYFSQLALDLGKDKLAEYAKKFGFNDSYSISGIPCATSQYQVGSANQISLAWSGIGQYTDLINPLQYLTSIGAIANKGVPVKPYFIKSIKGGFEFNTNLNLLKNGSRVLSTSTANKVSELMDYAVQKNYKKSTFGSINVCGKSGTAEVEIGKEPNSLFVGFVDDDTLPLAFIVVVEGGGSGNSSAMTIANTVLQASKKSLN